VRRFYPGTAQRHTHLHNLPLALDPPIPAPTVFQVLNPHLTDYRRLAAPVADRRSSSAAV